MANLWRTTGRLGSSRSLLPPYRSRLRVSEPLTFMPKQYASTQHSDNRSNEARVVSPVGSFDIPNTVPRDFKSSNWVLDHADTVIASERRLVASNIVYAFGAAVVFFGGAVFLARADTKSLIRATPKDDPSIEDLRASRLRQEIDAARRSISKYRNYIDKRLLGYYASWRESWIRASDAKKAAYILAGLNAGVFLAWQVALRAPSTASIIPIFMSKWFTQRPLGRDRLARIITPVTHMFSHYSALHFLGCMLALTSFSTPAGYYLSSRNVQNGMQYSFRDLQELSGLYHFLAFFVAAGVFASLGGAVHTAILARNALRSRPPRIEAWERAVRSSALGASGAIYSVVTVSTIANPDSRVGIWFLPFFSIAAKYGLMGFVGLDIYGLIAGWTTFGHAAHLGGVVFGAIYFLQGPQMWKAIRGPETSKWILPDTR